MTVFSDQILHDRAQFFFSQEIFLEAIRINFRNDGKNKSLRKASIIERLCNKRSLPPLERLVQHEILAILSPDSSEDIYQNNALLSIDIDGLYDALATFNFDSPAIKPILNSRQRRRAASSTKVLRELQIARASAWHERFGFSKGLSLALVSGRNQDFAKRHLAEEISRPTTLTTMLYDPAMTSVPLRPVGRSLWRLFENFPGRFANDGEKIHRDALKSVLFDGILTRQMSFELMNIFPYSLGKYPSSDIERALEQANFFRILRNLTLGIYENLNSSSYKKIKQESTASDIIHCFYLPYVDLFRADKSFTILAKSYLPEFSDRIQASLSDIASAFEK